MALSSRHCQITTADHPAAFNAIRFFRSRQILPSIFVRQNSTFDEGRLPRGHECPCQKHPWTNTAVRNRGNTMSGLPASAFEWSRNRKPAANNSRRTYSSGFVSAPRTAAIIRDRSSEETLSAITINMLDSHVWCHPYSSIERPIVVKGARPPATL